MVLTAASRLLRATDRIERDRRRRAMVSYEAEVRLRGPLRLLDPLLGPRLPRGRRPGRRAACARALAAGPATAGPRHAAGDARRTPARGPAVDELLEASVLGSFSRLGLAAVPAAARVRRRPPARLPGGPC